MAAAALITPTMVQRRPIKSSIISGSAERRLMELYLEGVKVTQVDWFNLALYLTTAECSNIFSIHVAIDAEAAGNDPEVDTFTYTSVDTLLVAAGATVGKCRARVIYWTE